MFFELYYNRECHLMIQKVASNELFKHMDFTKLVEHVTKID